MQHLDEGTIHAWLDGALSTEEAARAEAHVASCSMCADATAEARGLIAASSRILTALDNVPSIRGAGGAKGAQGAGRRSLTTWLVREKIAAVVTLVVAGGALALVMTRGTQRAAEVDLAAEPVRTFEVAAADSPAPPPVVGEEVANRESPGPQAVVAFSPPSASPRGVAGNEQSRPALIPPISQPAPTVIARAVPPPAQPTDDSLRPMAVAQAERAEARDASTETASSLAGKVGAAAARRRAPEAKASFSETRPTAPAVGAASGAAAPVEVARRAEPPRLVLEEKMLEGGRDVRRRIYSVDGILVTLDERGAIVELEERRAQSANAPRQDSTAVTTAIRWTDASGKEFTLTGAAPPERLERIRKLLGL